MKFEFYINANPFTRNHNKVTAVYTKVKHSYESSHVPRINEFVSLPKNNTDGTDLFKVEHIEWDIAADTVRIYLWDFK